MTNYELWDVETANLLGSYESREAALDAVRRSLAQLGHDAVASWELARADERGDTVTIARGDDLLASALGRSSEKSTLR